MEREAVIHPVAVSVRHREDVGALAIGVVHHDVEDGHPAERRRVLVDQRHEPVALVPPVEDAAPADLGYVVRGDEVDGILRGIRFLPELQHARSHGSVRQPGAGHDTPTERLRHEVGRDLAVGQINVGEVPQRSLA